MTCFGDEPKKQLNANTWKMKKKLAGSRLERGGMLIRVHMSIVPHLIVPTRAKKNLIGAYKIKLVH